MNIKMEVDLDAWESGECSDEGRVDCGTNKKQKKAKKHKKRRRRSSSDSSDKKLNGEKKFFNPYRVNLNKLSKVDHRESDRHACVEMTDITSDQVIVSTFANLANDIAEITVIEVTPCSVLHGATDCILMSEPPTPQPHGVDVYDHDYFYEFDKYGVDTCPNVYQYMMSLGLPEDIVSDLVTLFNRSECTEDSLAEEMEKEDEELINQIPIVEQSDYNNDILDESRYSPEPANKLVEPCYGPPSKNVLRQNNMVPLSEIIDPKSIPAVGPRDPRLFPVKNIPHKLSYSHSTLNQIQQEERITTANRSLEMTQTNVSNIVKECLRLYLSNNDITSDEYKLIFRKAVAKILGSGETKLDPQKIGKFIYSYVVSAQKSRSL